MDHGEHQIDQITDRAGFLVALRALKERSGLTFRQLAQRAADNGDVLARSTLADVLSRDALPRPEVLAAFVRACGQGDLVAAWLRARERLALAALVPAPEATGPAPAGDPGPAAAGADDRGEAPTGTDPADGVVSGAPVAATPGTGQRKRLLALLALAATALAAAVGAGVRLAGEQQRDTSMTEVGDNLPAARTATGATSTAPAGRVRIRPARTPGLCLGEGWDRPGGYRHEILVQRACAGATPPETDLEPVGDGAFIMWRHPVKGDGCLTIRGDDPGRFLLEPWEDCQAQRLEQVFRFEARADGAYRIRSARGSLCLGIRDDTTGPGEAALAEPCADSDDQAFQVDPAPETDATS
ncbi:helix-turn-helix domain-containing protein [Micromonospora sp. NPDC049240]|uniref:helix-turn-helix domain-containing protein n=1 Tax=Micromonospora sp. NPDC049240 TaxID=3155151 RepID=UPI0033C623B8